MNNFRERHQKLREELRSQLHIKRSWVDVVADFFATQFGTVWFLTANVVFFIAWMAINSGWIPSIKPFDRHPFNLLTMVVSLEAIVLSIIVLISQNRQSKNAYVREQIDFEVNVRNEEESTKLLVMVEQVARHLNVPLADDPELRNLEQRTDLNKIRARIEQDQ